MVRTLTILQVCLLLVGCSGGGSARITDLADGRETPGAPVVDDAGLAVLDSPGPGLRAAAYHCAGGEEPAAAPRLWIEADDDPASSELWVKTDGAGLTDLYVTLEAPRAAYGPCRVEWNPALDGRLLTIAVRGEDALELGLAGIRKATAAEVAACTSSEQLATLLADRWSLSGEMRLCTVHWEAADEDASVFDVRKTASNIYAPDQVTDLTIRVVDGEYELGWPARLGADYNQDGLVGVSDLTPLGMLYGLSQAEGSSVWLADACARVDGNGDGLIGVSDITPIGQNFDSSCYQFRVERSIGNGDGPGEQWDEVAIAPRATTTRTGEAVTSASRSPWQRLRDTLQPGWLYYRVTALGREGLESAPSNALLAPDGEPPTWPAGAGIGGGFAGPESGYVYIFEFNEDAEDDRGGAVSYAVQLTGGGDPDDLPLMAEFNAETSEEPVTSPFKMGRVLYKEDTYASVQFIEGDEYYIRLRITDEAGNSALSDWYGFPADYGTAENSRFGIDEDGLLLWVNREGTVRFTPPEAMSVRGYPLDVLIYVKPVAWDDAGGFGNRDDYVGVEPLAYDGGEVFLDRVLEPGIKVNVGVDYVAWDGSKRFFGTRAWYPYWWLQPLYEDAPDESYNIGETSRVQYLSDGTPYTIRHLGETDHLVLLQGGLPKFYPLEGVPVEAYSLSAVDYPPQRVPGTDTIVFHETTQFGHGSVTWWSPLVGVTGQAVEPEGVFTNEFGFEDYIQQWFPEDEDTLVGLRSMVQEADGGQVLELWEARLDGEMAVRELIDPPFELGTDHGSMLTALAEDSLVVQIVKVESFKLVERCCCVLDSERNWTVNDVLDSRPGGFDASSWEYSSIQRLYAAGDLSGYAYIHAQDGLDLDPEDQTHYTAIYKGSLLDSIETYMPLVEFTTESGFGHDYPAQYITAIPELVPPYDGAAVFNGNNVYYHLTDSSGDVVGAYGAELFGHINFHRCYPYFTRDGIYGGLANGLLSEDGQWLAVGQPGVLGVAVRNENN